MIDIVSVLSRLLSTLTQALQASGVDLSQTNISVKVDVGKRANRAMSLSEVHVLHLGLSKYFLLLSSFIDVMLFHQDDKKQSLNNQVMGQSIHGCFGEDSQQAHKKLRTGV